MTYPQKKFEEVCDVVIGGTPRRGVSKYWGGGDLPWVSIADLTRGGQVIINTKEKITRLGAKESNVKLLKKGTLLFSFKLSIGKLAFAGVDLYTNEAIAGLVIKNDSELDKKFLFYFLQQLTFDTAHKAVKGATLNKTKIQNLEIPLPPVGEQRKIAAKIEKQFAKIDEAARLRAEALAATEQILPAALHEIFSFAAAKGWEKEELGELMDIKHGFAFEGKYFNKERGEILLTPGNFQETGGLYFNAKNTKRYDGEIPEGFVLKSGDLVVVMTDLSSQCKILGNPAIIDKSMLHNQRIGKITLKDDQIFDRFLYYAFLSEPYKKYLRDTATGTTVRHTAPSRIYKVKITLPPLAEQKKIVQKLDALTAKTQTLKDLQSRQSAALKQLKQSILHAVFG